MKKELPVLTGEGVTSIFRNAVYLLGARWLTMAVRFFYAIALARKLGPELYGLYNYGMSLYLAFLPMTALGLGIVLSREIGRDRTIGARISAQALILRTVAGILASLLCGIIGWFSEGGPEMKMIIVIFSLALLGRCLSTWTQEVFTAHEASEHNFKQQAIFRTLEVVFGLLVLFSGGGILAIAVVHLVSWWLQVLFGFYLVRKHLIVKLPFWAWRGLKNLFIQGLSIGLGAIFINWLNQGPLVLFRHCVGDEPSLGQFALIMQIFSILANVPVVAVMASYPILSRSVMRFDTKDRIFAETFLRAALILGTVVGLFAMGLGPRLVKLIFGPRYLEAGYLLGPTLFLLIPWTIGNIIWAVYLARGLFFLPTIFSCVAAAVLTFCMPWFVAFMQTFGAVLATGVSMSLWALALILIYAILGELNIRRAVLRPGVSVLLAIGVYFLFESKSVLYALPASLVALIIGITAFRVFTPDDRSALTSLVHRAFQSRTKM